MVTNVQPNTKQHESFHEQKPMAGFEIFPFSHLGSIWSSGLLERWPPFSNQKGACGKFGIVLVSTQMGLGSCIRCWQQLLGALWFYSEECLLGLLMQSKLPLLSKRATVTMAYRFYILGFNFITSDFTLFFFYFEPLVLLGNLIK